MNTPKALTYYKSLAEQSQNTTILSEDELLSPDNKTFCMYPWTQVYVNTTSEVFPCCWSSDPIGNSKTHTLEEIWNSDRVKNLRKNMLTGNYTKDCIKCYESERLGFRSDRIRANSNYKKYITRTLNETNADGRVDRFELIRWQVNFSNLCNLKCRTCHHVCSSSWYQDQIKMDGADYAKWNKALLFPGKHETDIIEQLLPHLDYVEQIFFAGGEPLMMEEHYIILDELERRGKFDTEISYATNFTKFDFKGRSIFDYWKKFKNVTVTASADEMGARGEYIRNGLKWSEFEANRRTMLEINPEVTFKINATLNILNVHTLPEFHRNLVNAGLVELSNFQISYLAHPYYLRADILPMHLRDSLIEKYNKHVEWLKTNGATELSIGWFESVINYLSTGDDNSHLIPEFWFKTNKLDAIRNESLLDVIPELGVLQ